jgi:hypothetical protein|tara:strand:+ start:150 stop:323 length:174 start_codon:yes stop_codon:yes gene_type:complete
MSNNVMRWRIKKLQKQQLRLKKQLTRQTSNDEATANIKLQIEELNWKENDLVARYSN